MPTVYNVRMTAVDESLCFCRAGRCQGRPFSTCALYTCLSTDTHRWVHVHGFGRHGMVRRVVLRCDPVCARMCRVYSYKRVKGRSQTVEKRKASQPQKPHATSQPWSCLSVRPVPLLEHGYRRSGLVISREQGLRYDAGFAVPVLMS